MAGQCLAFEVSSQFHKQDGHGGYAYGYEDPNSQKEESRSAHGVTHGGYSYLDGHGKIQHLKYVADPKTGFNVIAASNLPQGPEAIHGGGGASGAYYGGSYGGGYSSGGYDHAKIVIGKDGVPIDTPEVQHARAQHLQALAQAHYGGGGHHLSRRSLPIAPIDTPEVQHAKAEHFAAYSAIASGHSAGYHTGPIKHVVIPHHGPIHYPIIHKGVPLDTPEVQHARAKHISALGAAYSSGGEYHHEEASEPIHKGYNFGQEHGGFQKYTGPIHIPVIHDGVPVDTPEVQHARAKHLAAVSQAQSYGGGYGEGSEGKWL